MIYLLFVEETMTDVRMELAAEEGLQTSEGGNPTHEVSEAGFLLLGLEMEEQQYVTSAFL
jgi:hypothetical protein